MSTIYRPLGHIPFIKLFDGRLEKYDIRERNASILKDDERLLDGVRCSLVAIREDDGGCFFLRPTCSPPPGQILRSITEEFHTDIVSEHDYRYWGFSTQEEMDARTAELENEAEDEYYATILAYVRGEPHTLPQGSVIMIKAQIAKALVDKTPSLMAPGNRSVLLQTVTVHYCKSGNDTSALTS